MPATAIIQQLRFELSAPDTRPARQLPERFSRLYHDRLAAILAEELGRFSPAGPAMLLTHLQVTVPPLAHSRLEQDLPEQFRTALRAALAALPAAMPQPAPKAEPLAALAYFLLHGTLPWNAIASNFAPNEALRNALQYHPGALRELLRRIGGAVAVRQRLARQLTDATLGRLLVLLEPIYAPFIKEYIAQTLAIHQRQALLTIPQSALRVIVYELVLADLLLNWHQSFTRQAFLEKQVRGLAAHYSLTYEELLYRLTTALIGRIVPTTLTATLQALQRQAQSPARPFAPAPTGPDPNDLSGPDERTGPAPDTVLVYYLRHGFLPHDWSPSHSFAALSAQLGLVLSQGRAALYQLGQAAGSEAAAYTLAHRFPLINQQIVHLLAPGQTRSFLALLAKLTARAALPPAAKRAYEQTLWQRALRHLLATSPSTAPPKGPVQQWLARPAGLPAGPAATAYRPLAMEVAVLATGPPIGSNPLADPFNKQANALFFAYLLTGTTGSATVHPPLPLALRQALRRLLQQDAGYLMAFLRQHHGTPSVLRRLGAITDFDTIAALVAKAQKSRPWYLSGATAAVIKDLLDSSPTTASVNTPQAWLRAAFLYFHLRPEGQLRPPASAEAGRLHPAGGRLRGQLRPPAPAKAWHRLKDHHQPPQAVEAWLLRRVARHPWLAQLPFFAWLLSTQTTPGAGGQTRYSARQTGESFTHTNTTKSTDLLGFATTSIDRRAAGAHLHMRALESPENFPIGLRNAGAPLRYLFSIPNYSSGFLAFRPARLGDQPGVPSFRTRPARPTDGPSGAAAAWRLAGTRPAEALEGLLAYLLNGTAVGPRALVRAMFRLVLTQQPAALRAVLRRYGPAPGGMSGGMGRRLANIATFAELARLVPTPAGLTGRQPVGQRALAALDSLAGAEGALLPAGLLFLRAAFLAFHLPPSGTAFSLRDAQRLAAGYQLPWQALLGQVNRLRQRWPALAATSFFARLWPFTAEAPPFAHSATTSFVSQTTSSVSQSASHPSPGYHQRTRLPVPRSFSVGSDFPLQRAGSAAQRLVPQHSGGQSEEAAAHEGLLYYLLHGQAPWWQPTAPSPSALRRTLAATARQPLIHSFLQRHALEAPVRHRIATLADFSLLHTLTLATGPGRQQRQLLRPAFTRLDQLLRAGPGGSQSRFHLFLREAYLTSTLAGPSPGSQLRTIRQLVTAAGMSWRGSLLRVGQLLRQAPALAADPFFALLLQQLPGNAAGSRLAQRSVLVISARALATSPAQRLLPASPSAISAAASAAAILEHYLRTGELPPAYTGASAASLVTVLLRSPDAGLLAHLRPYLALATARHRLAALVPSSAEFLPMLRGLSSVAYQALASLLRDWRRLQAAGLVRFGTTPTDLWVEVLALVQAPLPAHALPAALVQALVRGESTYATKLSASILRATEALRPGSTAARLGATTSGQPASEALRLLRLIQRVTQRGEVRLFSYLAALLAAQLKPSENRGPAASTPTPAELPPPLNRQRPLMRPSPLPPELRPETATYIANAGLVLVWPFLTVLFERLGYVAERQFQGIEQMTRAAYLLQFLATGEEQPPEHLLALNKLLCGVGRTLPLVRELPLTADEKATGESLLGAVIARWGDVLKNTSLAGLRETFLQRPGKLVWGNDRVTLTVETKTVDILLDQRPWSIALIKLPWMALPLYVSWR